MKVFIVAGEPSGDYIGSTLIEEIKQLAPDTEFYGIGGNLMEAAGLKLLFSVDQLSIIGIFEVIFKIFRVYRLMSKTIDAIKEFDPDVIVTIDSSGFTHRVAKKVKKLKLHAKIVHYVAPPVWAWRKDRAKKMSQFLDELMTLLPFEPKIFMEYGLKSVFVGHPIIKDMGFNHPGRAKTIKFQRLYCRDMDTKKIVLLPGSRPSELEHHLPILKKVVQELVDRYEKVVFFMPTIPSLKKELEEKTKDWVSRPLVFDTKIDKMIAYFCSNVAIAASGTVTIELARVELPSVVIYKTSFMTAMVVKSMLKTKFVCLLNILSEKLIVPELIQGDCTPIKIFEEVCKIIDNQNHEVLEQKKAFRKIVKDLSVKDPLLAAREVLKMAEESLGSNEDQPKMKVIE